MEDTASLYFVGNEYYGDTFKNPKIDGTDVTALLVRDPQNAYDKNAVGVYVGGRHSFAIAVIAQGNHRLTLVGPDSRSR